MGTHPPFLRARAQVNSGVAKPNWARRETKLASDEKRTPDLRWSPDGSLPLPPVEPPQDQVAQQPPSEDAAPLCVAAVAMHGLPPISTRPMSNLRQSPGACPTVHEDQEWTEEPEEEEVVYPRSGFHVSGNFWNIDLRSRSTKPCPMASFL